MDVEPSRLARARAPRAHKPVDGIGYAVQKPDAASTPARARTGFHPSPTSETSSNKVVYICRPPQISSAIAAAFQSKPGQIGRSGKLSRGAAKAGRMAPPKEGAAMPTPQTQSVAKPTTNGETSQQRRRVPPGESDRSVLVMARDKLRLLAWALEPLGHICFEIFARLIARRPMLQLLLQQMFERVQQLQAAPVHGSPAPLPCEDIGAVQSPAFVGAADTDPAALAAHTSVNVISVKEAAKADVPPPSHSAGTPPAAAPTAMPAMAAAVPAAVPAAVSAAVPADAPAAVPADAPAAVPAAVPVAVPVPADVLAVPASRVPAAAAELSVVLPAPTPAPAPAPIPAPASAATPPSAVVSAASPRFAFELGAESGNSVLPKNSLSKLGSPSMRGKSLPSIGRCGVPTLTHADARTHTRNVLPHPRVDTLTYAHVRTRSNTLKRSHMHALAEGLACATARTRAHSCALPLAWRALLCLSARMPTRKSSRALTRMRATES
eukprot:6198301-Pleurochrysis_carterae.AAC.3